MGEERQGLGRQFPPPLFVAALAVVGLGLQWLHPVSFQHGPPAYWSMAGIALLALSGSLALSARACMRCRRTPIGFSEPTAVILRSGPFARTRNPLYVSLVILLAGIGVVADSLWFAPLLVVLILFLKSVILREEEYLVHVFGKEYVRYKGGVRRWM